MKTWILLSLAASLAVAACSDDASGGSADAQLDTANDARPDGQADTPIDSQTDTEPDSAPDTPPDLADVADDAVDAVEDGTDDSPLEDTPGDTADAADAVDPDAPVVVSTDPESGAMVRLTDTVLFPGEVSRFVVNFDRPVFENGTEAVPLLARADHLGSEFSQELDVEPRQAFETMLIRFVPPGDFSAFPAGDYEVTVENVRSAIAPFPALPSYTWGFSARTCGDGTCDAEESSCDCPADCGSCTGCCDTNDAGPPAQVCEPGTANDACGQGGASCGVCLTPDECQGGAGCG